MMQLELEWKSFSFNLKKVIRTSKGIIKNKCGWLIRIKDSSGGYGWGEISDLNINSLSTFKGILEGIGHKPYKEELEESLKTWPGPVAFGIGSALAEIDGTIEKTSQKGWLSSPKSSILLPTGIYAVEKVASIIKTQQEAKIPFTFKLKVGINKLKAEKEILDEILRILPSNSRMRLDPNGAWNHKEANEWSNYLSNKNNIEWIEQPLPEHDLKGLANLSKLLPIALDESLIYKPSLRSTWLGWQVRRPSLEGDPRSLLKELLNKRKFRTLSTTFETGIGLRWIHHFAALQQQTSTPTAPGLALDFFPDNPLFSNDPKVVWEAA